MRGRIISKSRFIPVAFLTAFVGTLFLVKIFCEISAFSTPPTVGNYAVHEWFVKVPVFTWFLILGAGAIIKGRERTEAILFSLLMLTLVFLYLDDGTIQCSAESIWKRFITGFPFGKLAIAVAAPLLMHLLLVFPERRPFLKYGSSSFFVFLYFPVILVVLSLALKKWPLIPAFPFAAPGRMLIAIEYVLLPVVGLGVQKYSRSLLGRSRGYGLLYGLLWGAGSGAVVMMIRPSLKTDSSPLYALLYLLPAVSPYLVYRSIFSYPHIDKKRIIVVLTSGAVTFLFFSLIFKFFLVDIYKLFPFYDFSRTFFLLISTGFMTVVVIPLWRGVYSGADRLLMSKERARSKTLLSFIQRIPSLVGDLEQILNSVSVDIANLLQASGVYVYTAGLGGDEYILKGNAGSRPADAPSIKFQITSNGIIKRLMRTTGFLEMYNVESNPALKQLSLEDKIKIRRLNAVIAVPLRTGSGFLGVIFLGTSAHGGLYTIQQLEMAMDIAEAVSIAVENAGSRAKLEVKGKSLPEGLLDARDLKEELLPGSTTILPGFYYSSFHLSGKAEGGDFFDIYQRDEYRWIISFCELPENRSRALLIASTLKSAIRALYSTSRPDIERIMSRLNDVLLNMGLLDGPLPIFMGELYRKHRIQLTYVNADYPCAYVVEKGNVKVLQHGGAPLGAREEMIFSSERMFLRQSSNFLLLSGGLFGKSVMSKEKSASEEKAGSAQLQLFLNAMKESGDEDFDKLSSNLKEHLYRLIDLRRSPEPVDVTMMLFRPE